MSIIIGIVIIFVILGICDDISRSISKSEIEQKRKEEYEKEAAVARKQYPRIENWSEHPLFAQASAFLIQNVNNCIEVAKRTPVGAVGGITLNVAVETLRIYIGGNVGEYGERSFFYSSCGYDHIKVGYTKEETVEACKEFAVALSAFLSDYYMSRENISVKDAYIFRSPNGRSDYGIFSIELRNIQPRLKQI